MDVGPLEIALIVVAIVLIFGVGKLGSIGGALGKSIREFRRERDRTDDLPQSATTESKAGSPVISSEAQAGGQKSCPKCGDKMSENAKFCMGCGAKL
jgi:sec-independent protein translocase protein TatA